MRSAGIARNLEWGLGFETILFDGRMGRLVVSNPMLLNDIAGKSHEDVIPLFLQGTNDVKSKSILYGIISLNLYSQDLLNINIYLQTTTYYFWGL